jgi:hypothetical protein
VTRVFDLTPTALSSVCITRFSSLSGSLQLKGVCPGLKPGPLFSTSGAFGSILKHEGSSTGFGNIKHVSNQLMLSKKLDVIGVLQRFKAVLQLFRGLDKQLFGMPQ